VLVRKDDRERESSHQDEADGPSRIQIEPAPRHELETQVAVDQTRGESASPAGALINADLGMAVLVIIIATEWTTDMLLPIYLGLISTICRSGRRICSGKKPNA
jgi:hypothetical protein